MPLARYPNPAAPNTPFGAGLSNIADALFANQYYGGSAARAQASTEARDAMYAQHGALYAGQTRKADAERQLVMERLRHLGLTREDLERIARDPSLASPYGKAYAATGGKPIRGFEQGYNFSLFDAADNVETPLGTSNRTSTDALGRQRGAAAAELDARRKIHEHELRTGIKIGPPVIVNDPEEGAMYTAPGASTGRRVGMRPGASGAGLQPHYTGTDAATGEPQFVFVPKATGTTFSKPPPRPRIGQTFLGWDESGNERWSAVEQKPGVQTVKPPALIPNVIGKDDQGRPMVVQTPRVPGIVTAGPSTDSTTTATEDIPQKVLTNADRDAIRGAIERAAKGRLGDTRLEGRIMARAEQWITTPGSPHFGQVETGTAAAVDEILPGGTTGEWFSSNVKPEGEPVTTLPPITRPGPQQRTKTTTKTGGAQPASPVVVPPLPGKGPAAAARPPNKTDQQLITEGNQAIANGKDPKAVMDRLQAWGVQVH